jgi:hypothetical protein
MERDSKKTNIKTGKQPSRVPLAVGTRTTGELITTKNNNELEFTLKTSSSFVPAHHLTETRS